MIITAMNHLSAKWFKGHLPVAEVGDAEGVVAYDRGKLLAGCVMDTWTDTSVQCHLLIRNPIALRHGFLEICFNYIFKARVKKLIYGFVPSDNVKALKFNKKLGFTEKCRLEGALKENVDCVIMELKKENCRYLGGNHANR